MICVGGEKMIIFQYKDKGTYLPEWTRISIFDNKNENVRIEEGSIFSKDDKTVKFYTIPDESIQSIIKLISDAKYLFDQIPLKESKEIIFDGSINNIKFSVEGKKASFKGDNLLLRYEGFSECSKEKELVRIWNGIFDILKKNNIEW